MKIRKFMLLPILLLFLLTTACSLSQNPGPTGTPEGKVGHSMVYADSNVYVQDIYDKTLHYSDIPYGYTLYGTVESSGDSAVPHAELHAALVEVGAELYLSETDDGYLYVRTDNGTKGGSIKRYLPLEDSPLAEVYANFDNT